MSNEELVSKYQTGDVFALDELISQNKGLVGFISNKYHSNRNYFDQDDIDQQGWIGFFYAVKTYRGDLPNAAAFSTYAVKCIRGSILRLFIRRKFDHGELSLQEPIDEDITLEDILPDPNAEDLLYRDYDRKELRGNLNDAMNNYLTLRQREVLKLYFGWDGSKGWTFDEIGELYGITGNCIISNYYHRGLRKLRQSKWIRQELMERQIKKLSKKINGTEEAAIYLARIEAQRKRRYAAEQAWMKRRQSMN